MRRIIISIPPGLEAQIKDYIKTWGCTSTAEFFRYAAQTYIRDANKATAVMRQSNININHIRRRTK